jgi:hypothetical protein
MAASPSIAKLPKATPSPKIRPLKDRVAEIALDALHSSSDRGRPVKKREIDDLWGNS